MMSGRDHLQLRAVGALGLWAALFFAACAPVTIPEQESKDVSTIVFVHGAWGGGWQYHKVQPLLEQAGYRVYRPTLTGLGERVHLAGPEVGLGTHIEDIVKVFEFEDLEDVVLVGHSYGGMVITGVAERIPERIRRLVYLDAILPENGESVYGLFGKGIESMATIGGEGYEDWQLVPRWVRPGTAPPVDVPQSVLSFSEAIELKNPAAGELPASFILTIETGKEDDDFARFAARARQRGWPVVEMEGDHNPHWFQPGNFVQVLHEVIAQPAQ
jgi:pimeloyl-ACP methyl ester carboxylesterase